MARSYYPWNQGYETIVFKSTCMFFSICIVVDARETQMYGLYHIPLLCFYKYPFVITQILICASPAI